MRWRPVLWLLLSLSFFVAAVYFWRLGDKWEAAKHPSAQSSAAPRTSPLALRPSVPVTLLSEAGNLNSAPSTTSTNEAKASQFAYRLSNSTKTVGQLAHSDKAILLENALLDTEQPVALSIPDHLRAQGDPGSYIVQARGPLDDAFRALLKEAGASIVSYIPNNAYLVRASAEAAKQLEAEAQTVLPYEPYYKLKPSLLKLAVEQKPLPEDNLLNVLVFEDAGNAALAELEKQGMEVFSEEPSPFGVVVQLRAPTNGLPGLAGLGAVQMVELGRTRELANDLSRAAIGVSPDSVSQLNYLGLTGSNVLVNLNDTGVDATHPDLQPKVIGDSLISLVDSNGHGTHVAGIVAGTGNKSLTVTNAQGSIMPATTNQFRGMASGAGLFSMLFTHSDAYLQETAARTNAFISLNAWEYAGDNQYDLAAASYDAAVRDALPRVPGSQPLLLVFPAGNAGGGDNVGLSGQQDSVRSPGTAKNVITVGAVEQPRQIANEVYKCVPAGGTNVCTTNTPWLPSTDSSSEVAFFSSRGNVGVNIEGDNGRFKPDLVAPGTFVVSTRSAQWDQVAYYSVTSHVFQTFSNLQLGTNSRVYQPFFVPIDAVQVNISVITNARSPVPMPDMPIFVRQAGPPTNGYDFVRTNNVSIPPDATLSPRDTDWWFAVGNVSTQTVFFDIVTDIVLTNDLGNYFEVLSNLNNSIGTGPPYYYRYESGTSMAAADVAGTLALMQEFFEQRAHITNSPALMKALLINGARSVSDLYDLQVNKPLNWQGWGQVNLPNSLPSAASNLNFSAGSPMLFFDQSPTNALATGQNRTYNIRVAPEAVDFPLRITLVWTDPPGNPAASIKLVNDLDLIVTNLTDPTEVFFGNDFPAGFNFTQPWDTNAAPTVDVVNNVENIYIGPPLATNYSITVVGHRVNVNAVTAHTNDVVQDYALVASGGDGAVSNALTLTATTLASATTPFVTIVTNSFTGPLFDNIAGGITGGILFHQHAGANTPLLGTNNFALINDANAVLTVGMTNQWHFYMVTNINAYTNANFATFLPPNLAVPPMGTRVTDPANATRPEADIDLYVSQDFTLTNLSPVAVSNAFKSLGRGGSETVTLSNANAGIYYLAVKSEDQQSAEYAIVAVFSLLPMGGSDSQGNGIMIGLPALIPDGTPYRPGRTDTLLFGTPPDLVRRVVVSNIISHELYGDLLGQLTHGGQAAVLNNHSTNAAVFNAVFIYDDSDEHDIPGAHHSDGPGSLAQFAGKKGAGAWIFSEEDNAAGHTGAVQNVWAFLEKQQDLTLGITATILPGACRVDFVEVPPQATNLTIELSLLSGTGPISIEVCPPGGSGADCKSTIITNGLGGSVSINIYDQPPLAGGLYSVRVCNLGPDTVTVFIIAKIDLALSTAQSLTVTGGATNILDDAVTTSTLFVSNHLAISSLDVGMLINHQRVSDLAITLISPKGTRVLLFEDRGALSTLGLGTFDQVTNDFGAMTPFWTNDFDATALGLYAPGAQVGEWNVLSNMVRVVPDWSDLAVSNNILALGYGAVSNALPTTNATSYRLSFLVSHAPYLVGMIGWWPFDMDLTGTLDTSDIFGGHDGLAVGDVGVELGEVGEAYSGDGIYTSVKVPRCPDLDVGTGRGFSIEGWINPTAPATNSIEMIYVANAGNNTIQRFTRGGVGSLFASTGPGQPFGLAFDNATNLYVAKADNTIEKFTPAGAGSVFASAGLNAPYGMTFDGAGNLFVANPVDNTIEEFTPLGANSLFANTDHPIGLAFDSAGNLYVANQFVSTITKFPPGGGAGTVFATGSGPGSGVYGPNGLAFDKAGNLYVANYSDNTIGKITPGGAISVFANTGLNLPMGLAFDSAGNLYAANSGNNTIQKFTPGGIGSLFASTGLFQPTFITVGPGVSPVMSDGFEDAPEVPASFPAGANIPGTGWFVESGNVDVVYPGAGFFGLSDSGRHCVDLSGNTAGSISTNFNTQPGGTYVLSCAYCKNPGLASPPALANLDLTGQTTILLSYGLTNSTSSLNWSHTSIVFTASSPVTKLQLTSLNPGNAGMFMDTFEVRQLVAAPYAPLVEWNDLTNPSPQGVQFWLSGPPGTNAPGTLWANIWGTNLQPHIITTVTNAITNGGWQHVALTYETNSRTARIYTNGHLAVAQVMATNSFMPRTSGDLYFGFHPATNTAGTVCYQGGLDEFSLYDRALSDCEVAAICSVTNRGKYGTNVLTCPVNTTVELPGILTTNFLNGTNWIVTGPQWETDTIDFVTSSTNLTPIIVRPQDLNGGTNLNIAVDDFVLSALRTNTFNGLMHFTENTNLALVPIKFAPAPFTPTNFAPVLVFTNGFEHATQGIKAVGSILPGSFNNAAVGQKNWTVVTNTFFAFGTNSAAVVTNANLEAIGSNWVALPRAAIECQLPTAPGHRYQLSYNLRGPSAVGWWNGEIDPLSGRARDLIGGNHGNFFNGATNRTPDPLFAAPKVGPRDLCFEGMIRHGTNGNPDVATKIELGDPENLRFTNSFTIEGWIRPMTQTNAYIQSILPFEENVTEQIFFRGDSRHCLDPYYMALEQSGNRSFALLFHIEDADSRDCGITLESEGSVVAGQWQHVAVVFESDVHWTNDPPWHTNQMRMYVNGQRRTDLILHPDPEPSVDGLTARRPFRDLDPAFSPGVTIGNRSREDSSQPFRGGIDELSAYARALTDPEIAAIFNAGAAGKGDLSQLPAQSLAKARLLLDHFEMDRGYGDNSSWSTHTIVFTALHTNTVMDIESLLPGTEFDTVTLTEIAPELNYLPEQSLDAVNGEDPFGVWQLEIRDTRTGATNIAQLVEWQLHFTLIPTIPPPVIDLLHGIPYLGALPPHGIQYFIVDVPQWATAATNILGFAYQYGTSNAVPVTVFFDQTNFPPSITNIPFIGPASFGTNVLSSNTVPPLVIGEPYYLAVTNPNPVSVTFSLGVLFDIITLTNCAPLSNFVWEAGTPRYFQFDVPTNGVPGGQPQDVTFWLTGARSNLTVVLSQHLPLPDLTFYDYISDQPCTNDEVLIVLTNTTPFPIQTNRWYVGVFNTAATNVPFYVEACYQSSNSPVIIQLTNGVPYSAALTNQFVAPPGPPRWFFFQFAISNFVDAVLFELYDLPGDADLVLQRDVTPGMAPYYDGSFRMGTTPEQIVIRRSFEVPDLRGSWYLGIYNNEATNVSYTIRAVTPTNGVLVSAQPLAFTNSPLPAPHGVLVQWHAVVGETYVVQYSPDNVSWVDVATVVATTPFPTYEGQDAGFYQVIQIGNASVMQPVLKIKLWPGNQVRISWLKSFLGFTLQYTPDLNAKWTDLAPPLPIVVEGNEFVVYDTIGSTTRFYRLIK